MLVGLVFLIVELNRANRIAVYTAESTRSTQFLDMKTSRIENPEIIAKLMQPDPEFTDIEWVQALYTARQQINMWIDAKKRGDQWAVVGDDPPRDLQRFLP